VPCHDVHLAAGPSVGDVQSLLHFVLGCHADVGTSQVSQHHDDVRFPSTVVHGASRSPSHFCLEEVVVYLLELGQVVGGVDGEAILAEEEVLVW
jgi:hypothetical protein